MLINIKQKQTPLQHESSLQPGSDRGALRQPQRNRISSRFSGRLRCSCSCLFPQCVPWGQCCLSDRFHARHAVQNVLLTHHRYRTAILSITKPLPGSRLPCEKCLPTTEPIRTARYLLHTAPVRSSAPRHTPHHSGPAQRNASDHVRAPHPRAPCQRRRHGNGGRHHHGNVCGDLVDDSLPSSSTASPSHNAHIPATWNTHLQLRAPPVVKGQHR
ncbi:hypothetical protein COCON_G00090560 [Conger conger]|uniref:Uncharacterized protein n=1 Tax=Conger conger TaxID=82655 RepID=A0A9Q1I038_CONCO|nr:hypothetical protein COCON_G00090560 [Conger conger]